MITLARKLQLKPTHHLLLLQPPPSFAQQLQQEQYTCTQANKIDEIPKEGCYSAVLLFVRNQAELQEQAPQALVLLQPEGLLWIAYPKKASGIPTNLNRDKGWRAMAALGYTAVRQVVVNEVWSALRFRHGAEKRPESRFGVDPPGIDRKAKAVTVPAELQEALQEHGVLEVFEKLAFTHRKEYALAVQDAKKPEIKQRRIAKVVQELRQKTMQV